MQGTSVAISPPKPKEGYVYFVQSNEFTKIGRTKNIENRFESFVNSSPHIYTLFHLFKTKDMIKAEELLHRHYSEYLHGREWFILPHEVLYKIKENDFPMEVKVLFMEDK